MRLFKTIKKCQTGLKSLTHICLFASEVCSFYNSKHALLSTVQTHASAVMLHSVPSVHTTHNGGFCNGCITIITSHLEVHNMCHNCHLLTDENYVILNVYKPVIDSAPFCHVLCLGMHLNMMLCFMTQEPTLCSNCSAGLHTTLNLQTLLNHEGDSIL